MCTGKFMTPAFQKLTGFVIDQHIILYFICKKNNPAFTILHHFMTIFYRKFLRLSFTPFTIHPVRKSIVAVNRRSIFSEQISGDDETTGNERGGPDEILPVHIYF